MRADCLYQSLGEGSLARRRISGDREHCDSFRVGLSGGELLDGCYSVGHRSSFVALAVVDRTVKGSADRRSLWNQTADDAIASLLDPKTLEFTELAYGSGRSQGICAGYRGRNHDGAWVC